MEGKWWKSRSGGEKNLVAVAGQRRQILERYSHKGYLIKVVAMALAGEVALELSPILSWSNYNYKI